MPQNKQHSLLVLPFVNAILNFATEFFEMLTKKQSEHPQTVFQVFQVFRVFQVFHFAFGPQNRPVLVQIRTNPKNRYPPTSAIKWVRKTPKKAIHPLVYEHDTVLQAIGVGVFRRSRLFVRATKGKPAIGESEERSKPAIGDGDFRQHGGKLLHPYGETAIFRALVGSHPSHAKAYPHIWTGIVCGCVFK